MTKIEQGGRADRIRVLLIITRLAARGAPRHVLALAEDLDPDRFDVSILTGTCEPDEGDLTADARRRGLQVQVVPELQRDIRPVNDLVALIKIIRFVRRGHYDIVHTHISKAGLLGRAAAWMVRVPLIVHTYHGPVRELKSRILLMTERWAARHSDLLLAVSESVVEHQVACGIGQRRQYVVIPNGIEFPPENVSEAAPVRDDHKGPTVGTVGSLTTEKGTSDLIAAAGLIRTTYPTMQILLVGDGPTRPELEQMVLSAGLTDCVEFCGNVEDVWPWIARLDVFVLPSHSEGMSLALLEAMALGRPVVATRVGDAPELLTEDQLAEPRDPESLARALTVLLEDPVRRTELGARNRRVVADFDSRAMGRRVGQVYEDLLAGRKAA